MLDDEGCFRYLSPAVESTLGYGQDELLGTSGFERVHETDRDRVREAFERAISASGTISAVEYRFRTSDDEWRWFESIGRRLPADSSLAGQLVVTSRDITTRKRRERQLARQNERLESFAAIVSHDIRSPLSVARGNLDLYRQSGDDAFLDNVERAHDRIGELVTDVLSLAQSGLVVNDLSPVDLDECFARAVRTSPLDANATVVERPLPTVMGDSERLCTLFENLLRNAVEHGSTANDAERPDDDGTLDDVTVRVGTLDDGFYVADDGPGIPPSERERVLEAGYSQTDGGTGYGLAIVDSIAAAHEWTLRVTESEQGGARFEFTGVEFAATDAE